jgi:hypothetical protein
MANDDIVKRDPGGAKDLERTEDSPDLLSPFWAVMHRMRGGDRPREPTPEERVGQAHPGELVIATADRVLARIGPDGTVVYGEGATPDEAARELWEAIARHRPHFDARMNYLNLLELHVALLAVADQAYETAQAAAMAPGATENERFREEMSRRSLETRVHGIIEFAREFASMRPDLIATARRGVPGAQNGEGNQGTSGTH